MQNIEVRKEAFLKCMVVEEALRNGGAEVIFENIQVSRDTFGYKSHKLAELVEVESSNI